MTRAFINTFNRYGELFTVAFAAFLFFGLLSPLPVDAQTLDTKAGSIFVNSEASQPPLGKVISTLSDKGEKSLKKAQQFMDDDSYNYAVDELNRALSIEDHSDLHWFLGRAYSGAGERKLAYFSYRRAFKKDDSNIDVLSSLADLVLEFGSVSEAEELVPHIERLLPELTDTYKPQITLKKADLAYKNGKFIRAYRYFEEVYSSVPILSQRAEDGCINSLTDLAKAYSKSRRPEKELKVKLRLYQIRPTRELGKSIGRLWKSTGAPDNLKREVLSIIEHSKSLKVE